MTEDKKTKTPETKEEFDYKDLHNASTEEIAGEDIAKAMEDDAPETKTEATEEPKVEDKAPEVKEEPKTEVKDEPKVETKEEAPTTDEIAAQVSEKVTKEIVEKLVGKEETQEKKDKITEAVESFTTKEGRNPTWGEALLLVKDVTKEELKAEMQAEQEAKTKEQEETKQAADENEQKYHAYWDSQITDLVARKELPEAVDAKDPKDANNQAKAFIFRKMTELRDKAVAENKQYSLSAKEIWYEYKDEFKAQPPGADAPVFGSGKAVSKGSGEDYTYAEIHGKDTREIIAGE